MCESERDTNRILLCEDIALNAKMVISLLEKAGYAIDCAGNGADAVKLFVSSEPGSYAAVIMDIEMPVMNGYEATERIRASSHHDAQSVPILALSSNNQPEDRAKAFNCGMNAYLTKPVNAELLFRTLKTYISR